MSNLELWRSVSQGVIYDVMQTNSKILIQRKCGEGKDQLTSMMVRAPQRLWKHHYLAVFKSNNGNNCCFKTTNRWSSRNSRSINSKRNTSGNNRKHIMKRLPYHDKLIQRNLLIIIKAELDCIKDKLQNAYVSVYAETYLYTYKQECKLSDSQ